jgi:hypothetical protein
MTADRIFVVFIALAILGMVCRKAYVKQDLRPNVRLNQSVPEKGRMIGPAYLTSNLPICRQQDDRLPSVSIGPQGATATGAVAV